MNSYLDGAIRQQLERGRSLFNKIPKHKPREVQLLESACTEQLSAALDQLQALRDQPEMALPENQPLRLRRFRRVIEEMNFLEAVGIAALERYNQNDQELNVLIQKICSEISYPRLPPVVVSSSQQYFYIQPRLNLMCIPPAEGDFLLHLPDLYHELAHPLVLPKHDRRVKPFQDSLLVAISGALDYINAEKEKEERRRGPDDLRFYLHVWGNSWWKWVIELFCDLFALYTVGPAFAWAHYHLCAQMAADPFQVPTLTVMSHPPDDARMKAMLFALEHIGFGTEAAVIRNRWNGLIAIAGARAEPEYRRCVPDGVLKAIVDQAFKGVSEMGCRIARIGTQDLVYSTLNSAWTEFWSDPQGYVDWEKGAVTKLREQIQN